MDLTVLELHLHDVEFNAPFSSGRSSDEETPTESTASTAGDDLSKRLGPIGALAAFAGLALLARYLRGGEATQSSADEVEA